MTANCFIVFLCLAGALLTTGTVATTAQVCPKEWSLHGTRCFKFFPSKKTWMNAEESCQSHSANLASIHSAKENAFILSLIHKATKEDRRTWLGGLDAVKEGHWMWIDGSSWDYTNWHSTEPNNVGGKEHTLMINWQATFWNDLPASHSLNYICAKDSALKSVSISLNNYEYKCTPQLYLYLTHCSFCISFNKGFQNLPGCKQSLYTRFVCSLT